MIEIGFIQPRSAPAAVEARRQVVNLPGQNPGLRQCPKCGQAALIRIEDCDQCTSCDYSKCG